MIFMHAHTCTHYKISGSNEAASPRIKWAEAERRAEKGTCTCTFIIYCWWTLCVGVTQMNCRCTSVHEYTSYMYICSTCPHIYSFSTCSAQGSQLYITRPLHMHTVTCGPIETRVFCVLQIWISCVVSLAIGWLLQTLTSCLHVNYYSAHWQVAANQVVGHLFYTYSCTWTVCIYMHTFTRTMYMYTASESKHLTVWRLFKWIA